jgi:Mrp family chromosome partitioning ATPase
MSNQPTNQGPSQFPMNADSHVQKVIAVMSGKGGVGKSSVTSLLAIGLARAGKKVGVLDADITGPSIPKLFGVKGSPEATAQGLAPRVSSHGIKLMSMNLLLQEEDMPVIWRAPLLSQAISQFWTNTVWGDLDYLLVDLPPGTGDVPLTVMQSLPLAGIVMVTSPQSLALMVVRKAVHMAEKMDIQILGLVENMSFLECPHCGEKTYLFGHGKGEQLAAELSVPMLMVMPIDPKISELGDVGRIEDYQNERVELLANALMQTATTWSQSGGTLGAVITSRSGLG